MKILRFLGFLMVLVVPTLVNAEEIVCPMDQYGSGGACTTCPPKNTSLSAPGRNLYEGQCYTTCPKPCEEYDWSNYIPSEAASYFAVVPFFEKTQEYQILFYGLATGTPNQTCDTLNSKYCNYNVTCSSGSTLACKPGHTPVEFRQANGTLITTYYVVNTTAWSTQDTTQDTQVYSPTIYPVFQAPTPSSMTGFKGYYDAQTGGTQIIGSDLALTFAQANGISGATPKVLYAQYEGDDCETEFYLSGGTGGEISSNCSMPLDHVSPTILQPTISPKCMPTNGDENCTFTGFYYKGIRYYDENLNLLVSEWDNCDEQTVTLTAGWDCPKQYIVQCPDAFDPDDMKRIDGNSLEAGDTFSMDENNMLKACYHTCGENQTLTGWDVYLDSSLSPETTLTSYPIEFVAGETYGDANPITLMAHCENNQVKVTYKCGAGTGAGTSNYATIGQQYDVLSATSANCTAPSGYEFLTWNASTGGTLAGGAPVNPWTINEDVTLTADWIGTCNLITFDDNNAAGTNENSGNPQRKRTGETYWYMAAPGDVNMCGKAYESDPQVSVPTNGNAIFRGYFAPNDSTNAIFGTNGRPTSYGNSWTTTSAITLKALWDCPTGYTWNDTTKQCESNATSATYLCYKTDEGKVDNEVTLVNYAVRPLSWYHQCNINQNNFNGWLFSGDNLMHTAGSTISPWTYGSTETFVPAYNARFDCNTTHWQTPSGGNHSARLVILGDGLSMPAMNCEPRSAYAGWLPDTPNWTSTYTAGLTSPIPGASCNGDISVVGGGNFNWSCPTDLTFAPDDDLITQTINLSCGSTSGQITVSYGDDISAMVTQWFNTNCHGGPCQYPTNPTTYAHGYWKICADWNGVTPPGLTPVVGESGCYQTDPAHPNYDFTLLDSYWNQIDNFSVTSVWRCPKWVKYKCTADSEALYQDNMSYAAYYEEPYTVLDHETVGCNDSGYEFAGWYKEDQPSVEYDENETVQSWPYEDVVILVGKNGDANDYNIIYNSLGGDDMNSSSLCQHTFTYSANAQDFNPDISECVPTRALSNFLGWCASSNTAGCTPIEQIPAGQNANLNLYAIWECILPYHSNPAGTACVACGDNLFWNGTNCQPCPTSFPHSKHPFTWSEKSCYRECPSNTILGAAGQTCDRNADLYGLTCTEDVDFTAFVGSSGKQIEFKGNSDAHLNTCDAPANTYCPRGLFGCGGMASPFKPMTAPVNFYDATGQQNFGSRFIFGSRGGGDTIDLGSGQLWSFLAGPGQKSDVLHNNVGGVMMDYQYTHIIYPTYAAPEADNIPGNAFEGYYYPRTNGTQYVDDDLALNHTNAQTVLGGPSGNSNTARSLYANYSGIEYSVTYNCGTGGGTPPATVTGIHLGDSFTPAANICTNPGHEFGGWIVSNSGEIKQPGTPFTWQYTENKIFTADWGSSIVYHINYELYGGTASNTGMPTTYTYESGATINGVPTRDNSIFDGWCTDNTLQNCAMTQTILPNTTTGDKTFYAKWRCESGYTLNNNLCDSNTITIIYANGGHGVAPTEPSSCTYGLTFTLPAAIVPNPADGYTFNKWTVNGGNFGASTQIACDYTNLGVYQGTVTITATWGTNPIIIDWNENGGNALPNGSCIYTDDLTLTNAPTYNGYTFNGWLLADGTTYANPSSTKPNGCVLTYLGVASGTSTAITAQWCQNCVQPEHGQCTLTPHMNGECEYTATCDAGYDVSGEGTPNPVCSEHKYTITYRPNGGLPATDQVQTVNYGAPFTSLDATTFTKTNNILTGWTPVSGGTFITGLGTHYSYNVASDTIVDATWGTCTCTKGTGVATCTTSVANNTCQAVATCEDGYINPNVLCIGTTCDAACSECPAGFISVNNECQPCPPGTYQFGTQCLSCPDDYISPEGATECTPCENGYSSNADHTACVPNTITLMYTNGGHGTAPAQSTCLYNRTFILPAAIVPTPTDGYTFNKWSVNNNAFNANAAIVCNYANLGVYNGTVVVVATWNADTYLVSFDANGGTGGQTTPVNAVYNQAMPSISTVPPVKSGYTFMGWYDNANYQNGVLYYTANGLSARTYDKTTNTTLYAGWYANTITLNFANGGHGTAPNSKTCTYGENVTLPTAIVAEGFAFKNWAVANRTFNASATIVCDETNLGVSSGSVTVTAQWQPKTYTVTYNCGTGGGNAPAQGTATYDANFTPATNTCQYTGHVFTGWRVSDTTDIRESGVAFKWRYMENKVFTAQWDAEAYNIVYELNGGTNYAGAPQTYTYGVGARIDGTPTRTNSAFKGWCTDAQLQNCATMQNIARNETGTKTFYVKWACENGFIANADNTACDSCPNAQHAENGECVDNVIQCELPDANYATRTWSQASGAYGPCTVVTCAPDYHLVSNVCVKDTRECTVANGYGTQEWNGTQWTKCVAEVCEAGFEIVGDSCAECSNRRQNGEIVVSSYAEGCEIASCMYHGQKYILNNNECELICETKSDETGSMAWNESRQKCARTCNPGYKMW